MTNEEKEESYDFDEIDNEDINHKYKNKSNEKNNNNNNNNISKIQTKNNNKTSQTNSPLNQSNNVLKIPNLKRVESKRISQLGPRKNFRVVTPLESDFDAPDLLDTQMYNKHEGDSADYDHDGNIFSTEQGGMIYLDDEGNKGNEIYFAGIIDILQKYNQRKKKWKIFYVHLKLMQKLFQLYRQKHMHNECLIFCGIKLCN